jgi:hypothetical protein
MTLPEGYDLEAKVAPASYPGDVLSYKIQLQYNHSKNTLQIQRDFLSTLIAAEAKDYAIVKQWYDAVATSDQHNLVLIKKEASSVASTPAPAAAP